MTRPIVQSKPKKSSYICIYNICAYYIYVLYCCNRREPDWRQAAWLGTAEIFATNGSNNNYVHAHTCRVYAMGKKMGAAKEPISIVYILIFVEDDEKRRIKHRWNGKKQKKKKKYTQKALTLKMFSDFIPR